MDRSFDFQPVYPHHDLLIGIGEVELAMDHLDDYDADDRQAMQPELESRKQSLLEALDHLLV